MSDIHYSHIRVIYMSHTCVLGLCLRNVRNIFKPGMRPLAAHAWFLEIALVPALVCVCVCVCLCVSPEGINNQWCDMV